MAREIGFISKAIVGTLTLTAASALALAQQQFGPSPQAMYKQNPGSAPTYVSYGVATITPGIAAATARQVANSTTSRPAAKVTVTKPATTTVHRRTTQTAANTTGR